MERGSGLTHARIPFLRAIGRISSEQGSSCWDVTSSSIARSCVSVVLLGSLFFLLHSI